MLKVYFKGRHKNKLFFVCISVTCFLISCMYLMQFTSSLPFIHLTWINETYSEIKNSIEEIRYLVHPKLSCNARQGFLIVIKSAVNKFEERTVIRNTWVPKALSLNMSIIFSVGISSDTSINDRLMAEANKFGDSLQTNFLESYHRLTLKVYASMMWISKYCSGLGYVFVTDTDVIVVPQSLLDLSQTMAPINNTVIGHCYLSGSTPVRYNKSKWYISEEAWPYPTYPQYCSGTGYLMTGDVPDKLLNAIPGGPENWQWAYKRDHIEDVIFTGYLRQLANVTVKHDEQFISKRNYLDLYSGRTITIHSFRPAKEYQMMYNVLVQKVI